MRTGELDLRHNSGMDLQVYNSSKTKLDSGCINWPPRRACLWSTPIDQTVKSPCVERFPRTWAPHRLHHVKRTTT
eukprot:7387051-Pyramimonas_sp.AAC.3